MGLTRHPETSVRDMQILQKFLHINLNHADNYFYPLR